MINEVLYCERLLYLEYVQGEWADKLYTADGPAVHRRVNEQEKALTPPPDDEDGAEAPPYVARSVSLSSEKLGASPTPRAAAKTPSPAPSSSPASR